jgi:branched-chain amino acid transport system permease protein
MKSWLKRITLTDIVMWGIGLSILLAVIWGSIATLRSGKYSAQIWQDLIIFGLTLGSIYALIALGYTLVYGILRMINFAHSEVFMSGPFTAYFLADYLYREGFLEKNPLLGYIIIILFAMLISMGIALLVERIAYRPLRYAPRLVPLITAIGISIFLMNLFRGLFGSNPQTYPELEVLKQQVNFLGLQIPILRLIVVFAAIVMMVTLYVIVMLSKFGKAMRAVSESKDAAALMGIDVDYIITVTFGLGGALAGAAGVLYAMVFRQVKFDMGFFPGIKAFTAAVLGVLATCPAPCWAGCSWAWSRPWAPACSWMAWGSSVPINSKTPSLSHYWC